MDKRPVDTEQLKDLVHEVISGTRNHLLNVNTTSKCNHAVAHRHIPAVINVFLLAYSLSQHIYGSVVV